MRISDWSSDVYSSDLRVGVEKFRAIRKDQNEGEYQGRRDAPALDQDRVFLDSYGLPWEIVVDGSTWVLIHNFPMPEGYSAQTDRKSVVEGKSVSVRVDLGGRRILKKKTQKKKK